MAYIRETPGVRSVEDIRFEVSGRKLTYDCTVRTEEGTAGVMYEAGLQYEKRAPKRSVWQRVWKVQIPGWLKICYFFSRSFFQTE